MYTGSIPVLASKSQGIELAHITERDIETHATSTDYQGTPMRVDHALQAYTHDHLHSLKGGAERLNQLNRVLESHSCSDMHTITNVDLTQALSRWTGGTRNRYGPQFPNHRRGPLF